MLGRETTSLFPVYPEPGGQATRAHLAGCFVSNLKTAHLQNRYACALGSAGEHVLCSLLWNNLTSCRTLCSVTVVESHLQSDIWVQLAFKKNSIRVKLSISYTVHLWYLDHFHSLGALSGTPYTILTF